MDKKIVLTGDRPTGKLHLGHYVGSLRNRVKMQESNEYEMYIMIADMQAFTDNANKPEKRKKSVIHVAIDNLSVGINPEKATLFVQSSIPELSELTMYYMNLVTVNRAKRNPTIKSEIKERGFSDSVPVGFLAYPISQAADITAFNATHVPVGDDQLPILEQDREIVKSFYKIYGKTLTMPEPILSKNKNSRRLPGLDGKNKMSKSLNNCIYLSDDTKTVTAKVMSMYTDPNHLKIEDKGDTKNNPVFLYLDALCKDRKKFDELKKGYEQGGVGDVIIKNYLIDVVEETLIPIREKRKYYESHLDEVYTILKNGSVKAERIAHETLKRVRKAVGVEYYN